MYVLSHVCVLLHDCNVTRPRELRAFVGPVVSGRPYVPLGFPLQCKGRWCVLDLLEVTEFTVETFLYLRIFTS